MAWQQKFLETFGTGGLGGMSFRTWLRCLQANQFAIDSPYLLRAAVTTLSSLQNSLYRRLEQWRYGQTIREATIQPPVFILGLWRSGTTHLHNLLAQDPRFAFPNTYQVFFPHSFLLTESWNASVLNFLLPARRIQDNVKLGADQPQEDDFAIAGMTGMSFNLSMAFPRRADEYSRFITFKHTSPKERYEWREAFELFLKKLTVKYDRPVVLKSPAHTGHVRELVDLFPGARFVLIHRDPYEVFSSAMHCFDKVFNMWALQRLDSYDVVGSTINNFRDITEKYFAERHLVPRGQLVEIAYQDLERAPIDTLRRIYSSLELPKFDTVEQTMRAYLDSLGSYQRNSYQQIDVALQYRLAHEWRAYFSEWGYTESANRKLNRAA